MALTFSTLYEFLINYDQLKVLLEEKLQVTDAQVKVVQEKVTKEAKVVVEEMLS